MTQGAACPDGVDSSAAAASAGTRFSAGIQPSCREDGWRLHIQPLSTVEPVTCLTRPNIHFFSGIVFQGLAFPMAGPLNKLSGSPPSGAGPRLTEIPVIPVFRPLVLFTSGKLVPLGNNDGIGEFPVCLLITRQFMFSGSCCRQRRAAPSLTVSWEHGVSGILTARPGVPPFIPFPASGFRSAGGSSVPEFQSRMPLYRMGR